MEKDNSFVEVNDSHPIPNTPLTEMPPQTVSRPIPRSEKLVVFIRENRYEGNLSPFYEADDFSELAPLKANWKAIRDEIMAFEKRQGQIYGINSNEYVSAQFEGINWATCTWKISCGASTVTANIFRSSVPWWTKFPIVPLR